MFVFAPFQALPCSTRALLNAQAIFYALFFFRERNAEFVDNSVTTSKYTALNFVPLFLFLQFSRMANAYFLLICFLQIIPVISITNGIPTSIFPLSFVLTFDGFFSAREDYRRHQDDAKANSQTTLTMGPDKTFKRTEWRNIRVGDIVKVCSCVCSLLPPRCPHDFIPPVCVCPCSGVAR